MNTNHPWKSSVCTRKRALSTKRRKWEKMDKLRFREIKQRIWQKNRERGKEQRKLWLEYTKWKRQKEVNTNGSGHSCGTSDVLVPWSIKLCKTAVTLDKQRLERKRKSNRMKRTCQRWSRLSAEGRNNEQKRRKSWFLCTPPSWDCPLWGRGWAATARAGGC